MNLFYISIAGPIFFFPCCNVRLVHFAFPAVDKGLDMALGFGIEGGTRSGTDSTVQVSS